MEWVLILGGALLVAVLVRNYVLTTYWIPSPSMEPTLIGSPNGGRHDRVIVNRLSYDFHAVHRGDIVVFSVPKTMGAVFENGKQIKVLIKRVIGLPGEDLEIRDHGVYIDGHRLAEPYLPPSIDRPSRCRWRSAPHTQTSFRIPKGDVLVLGDNRGDSEDGRCFGPIPESSIVGRAFIRIWPLGDITWLWNIGGPARRGRRPRRGSPAQPLAS